MGTKALRGSSLQKVGRNSSITRTCLARFLALMLQRRSLRKTSRRLQKRRHLRRWAVTAGEAGVAGAPEASAGAVGVVTLQRYRRPKHSRRCCQRRQGRQTPEDAHQSCQRRRKLSRRRTKATVPAQLRARRARAIRAAVAVGAAAADVCNGAKPLQGIFIEKMARAPTLSFCV